MGDEKISRIEAVKRDIPIYRASPKQFYGKKFEDFLNSEKKNIKTPLMSPSKTKKHSTVPVTKIDIDETEYLNMKR